MLRGQASKLSEIPQRHEALPWSKIILRTFFYFIKIRAASAAKERQRISKLSSHASIFITCTCVCFVFIFSSPEPKAHGELIVYRSIRRPSVCASVRKHFQT